MYNYGILFASVLFTSQEPRSFLSTVSLASYLLDKGSLLPSSKLCTYGICPYVLYILSLDLQWMFYISGLFEKNPIFKISLNVLDTVEDPAIIKDSL